MEVSFAPGHLLRGRFEIAGVLGRGGMGVVYEALDREQGTRVALKLMREQPSAQSVYHFKREFRTLADLHHPNLVRLGELFGEGSEWFFTMELVHGVDLLTWVRGPEGARRSQITSTPSGDDTLRVELGAAIAASLPSAQHRIPRSTGAPPSASVALRSSATALPSGSFSLYGYDEHRLRHALGQLAAGISALHAAGHVHRDLKPSNVLVTPEGRVVLIDFGIARPHLGGSTATRRAIEGTVVYMSPEQANGDDVGPPADWYSVGAMLFEAITGVVPFDGPPLKVLARKSEEPPPWPSSAVPCPPDLDALVVELLAPDPAERPDLETILRVAGTPVAPGALPEVAIAQPFVGRDLELRVLREAFRQHRRRARPIVARVSGESGVGKSALVRHFLEDLQRKHPEVVRLTGRCYANELVPYKAWDGVIDALTRHLRRLEESAGAEHVAWLVPRNAPALARVFPVLARVETIADLAVAEGPPAPRSPERLRRDAFDALRELLRNLSREGPIVVVIDDWHWADRDSELLFEDLALHPEAPPLLLVVTQRGLRDEPWSAGATTLELGRLTEAETRALAGELAQGGSEDELLDEVVRESGGHPMFLQQLMHRVGQHHGTLRLDDVIRERARALPEAARVVLELVCVAGVPLSRDVVLAASGLERARCTAALDDLVGAQLLRARAEGGRFEPWHDRIREAVEASLSEPVKAGVHAALADALSRVPGDDASTLDVVRHLAAAGHGERAAQAAEIAARRAQQALAFDRAAELYRVALELGRHGGRRELELRLALAEALSDSGRGALEAAQGFLAAADATTDPDRALELRTRALEQLSISGHISQALELLRRLCRDVGVRLPRSRLATGLAYFYHRVRLRMFGLPARVDGAAPPRSAAEHRLYMTAFMHLPILDPLLANWLHARTLVLALRTRDRAMLGLCLCREAGIAMTFEANNVDHCLRASQLAHALFEHDTEIDHRAWLRGGDGIRCYFSGRFQTALALFRDCQSIWGEESQHRVAHLSQIAVFVFGCQRYLGRVDALRRELSKVRREAAWKGNTYLEVTSTLATNLGVLLIEGPTAARADLARVPEDTQLATWGANAWYRVRAEAEIDLHGGAGLPELREHLGRLAQQQRTQFAWVVTWGAEMKALEARLLLACADRGDTSGLARARKIARGLLKHTLPYGPIWGGLIDAAARLRSGDAVGGRAVLEECAVQAELHGYALYAACARARLGELRGAPSDAARAYFEGEGISDVEGALRAFAPGFAVKAALPAGSGSVTRGGGALLGAGSGADRSQ